MKCGPRTQPCGRTFRRFESDPPPASRFPGERRSAGGRHARAAVSHAMVPASRPADVGGGGAGPRLGSGHPERRGDGEVGAGGGGRRFEFSPTYPLTPFRDQWWWFRPSLRGRRRRCRGRMGRSCARQRGVAERAIRTAPKAPTFRAARPSTRSRPIHLCGATLSCARSSSPPRTSAPPASCDIGYSCSYVEHAVVADADRAAANADQSRGRVRAVVRRRRSADERRPAARREDQSILDAISARSARLQIASEHGGSVRASANTSTASARSSGASRGGGARRRTHRAARFARRCTRLSTTTT